MKNSTVKAFLFALLVSTITFSQSKVKEKDVIGEWKFHLNLDKAIERETKDSDGIEKIFVEGILNTVNKLVEKVDIKFHFKKNNILVVTQNSLSDYISETEKTYKWKITKDGKLVTDEIDDDKLKVNSKSNTWMLKNGNLVSVDDENEMEENVWMERVK